MEAAESQDLLRGEESWEERREGGVWERGAECVGCLGNGGLERGL